MSNVENNDSEQIEDNQNDQAGTVEDSTEHTPNENQDAEPSGAKTFDESYIKELREENKRYRLNSKRADELAERLHAELVKADGRLQDPTDLPFAAEHLEGEKLTTAITELLERKPHLKSRRVSGDIGAGSRGESTAKAPDLISMIRNVS